MRTALDRYELVALTLALLLLPSLAGADGKTHVGVPSRDIINLATGVVPNDNSGGHRFAYDTGALFSVPEDYSFVITDVWVRPNSGSFDPTDQYQVAINADNAGSRHLFARWRGGGGFQHSMTTGVVMPAGATPTARNTGASTHDVVVQLQGYFVKGEGLPAREPRF